MPPQPATPSEQPNSNQNKRPDIINSGIQIDDVNRSVWQYVKTYKKKELLAYIPLVLIWEIFTIFLFIKVISKTTGASSSNSSGRAFGNLMALPIVAISPWLYKIRKQFEDAFLEEFASRNGYSFDKNGIVNEAYGSIFKLSGEQKVSDVVSGQYRNTDLRLFLYEQTTGSSRNAKSVPFTVIELDLHGKLPTIFLSNNLVKYGDKAILSKLGVKNKISLEGDFNKHFTLYAPQNYAIEVLEVFSPDTMAILEDNSKKASVEFIGNRIYIYTNGLISKNEDLVEAFNLAKQLINKIAPVAERFSNDPTLVLPPINILKNRKSHPLLQKLSVTLSVIFILIGLGITGYAVAAPTNKVTSHDLDVAMQLSNTFLTDIQQGRSTEALNLESPNYRKKAAQQIELTQPINFFPLNGQELKDRAAVFDRGTEFAIVIYTFNDQGRTLNLAIYSEKLNNTWYVYGLKTSYQPIPTTP